MVSLLIFCDDDDVMI